MEHLVFLYTIICYMFSFATYFFAIFTAFLMRKKSEWLYVLVMTAFLCFLVPSLVENYLEVANVSNSEIVERIFSIVRLAGFGLMIYSVPAFIHAITQFTKKKIFDAIFLLIAAIITVTGLVFMNTPAEVIHQPILHIILGCTIAYTVIFGNLYSRYAAKKDNKNRLEIRWRKIMIGVTGLTIILMPLSMIVDMFPDTFPGFVSFFPGSMEIYPLYYLLWNLLYVIFTFPLLLSRDSSKNRGQGLNINSFGFSRREREIALLIIEGLSYQEIADRLFISIATVKTHISRIYDKSGVGNKMELAKKCRIES